MDWKSLIPRGLELSLTWRGAFRFLEEPDTQRRATWHVVARVQDPVRFALSGKVELQGTFSMEPDVAAYPVTGRVEWYLQEKREVLHDGSFEDEAGAVWRIVGVRPLALRSVGDGFGHLHCQLLKDEKVVAVGVLSSGIEEVGQVLRSLRTVYQSDLEATSAISPGDALPPHDTEVLEQP